MNVNQDGQMLTINTYGETVTIITHSPEDTAVNEETTEWLQAAQQNADQLTAERDNWRRKYDAAAQLINAKDQEIASLKTAAAERRVVVSDHTVPRECDPPPAPDQDRLRMALQQAQMIANMLGHTRYVYARYFDFNGVAEPWTYGSTDVQPHEWLKTHPDSTVRFLFRVEPDTRLDVI